MEENSGMKNLVLTVNKLQETFKNLEVPMDIDLPQIAVVGIQSSGKSSVLEKFVGRDFLPRGSGIVTRRPLILQLINNETEYAKFDHSPTKYIDFKKVMKEIEDETDRVTGNKKGISNKPIILKVFSPNVLNLTLIDLPGMTKVPIGDQPSDIEDRIRSMILEFIEKETCLILAVSPANMDLANSDSLKLAKEVDPLGLRTIGVLTKLDLMDKGTDAVDILENRIFPLRRGYIGVVNRSQKDIDDKLDISKAAKDEMKFFTTHQSYKHIAHKMGTQHLQKVLNEQLTNHIRETLPRLRERIKAKYEELRKEIVEFGDDDPNSYSRILMEILNQFRLDFETEIDGHGALNISPRELTFGYQINKIYNEKLPHDSFRSNFDEKNAQQLYREILNTIRNANGINTNLFMSDKAFEAIVKFHIDQMKVPVVHYVDLISSILMNIIRKYADKVSRFPKLRDEMKIISLQHIQERERLCKERLEEMIECEMAYINKRHDDFIGASGVVAGANNEKRIEKPQVARKPQRREDNLAVHKGSMTVINSTSSFSSSFSGGERFWFVLTLYSIQLYKDESEQERKLVIATEKLKLTEIKGKEFKLFHSEGKNIYRDSSFIRLSCKSPEELRGWVERFGSVGIVQSTPTMTRFYRDSTQETKFYSSQENFEDDVEPAQVTNASASSSRSGEAMESSFSMINVASDLEKQVETIKQLADSYLKIVMKGMKDRIPKMITYLVINSTRKFIDGKMLTHFYQNDLVIQVMQRPPSELVKSARVKEMFEACKEALRIIDDNLVIS